MKTESFQLMDHHLTPVLESGKVIVEKRPVLRPDGTPAKGLHNLWISLNNPEQLNSYNTAMIKEVILAFRRASVDRKAVAVIFTATGTRAFCSLVRPSGGGDVDVGQVRATECEAGDLSSWKPDSSLQHACGCVAA